MMVGGHEESVQRLAPILDVLAPPDGWRRFGDAGAGHFVKMVHNGVEYGMMQAYAEGFELMHKSKFDARPQGGRRPVEPRLGRPLVAVRAGREGVRRGGQRPRGAQGPRQRLRRGPLDDHRRDRPRRADAGDHRLAVRALLLARRGRLHPQGARRAAQPVRGPRRRALGMMAATTTENPLVGGPRAAPGPAHDAGDLRRDRRPRAPQAAAGALQPRARGRAAGALQPDRRLAPRPDRRRLPRPGARVDRAVLAPQAGRAAARRAGRRGCATSASRSTTRPATRSSARRWTRSTRRPASRSTASTTSRPRRSSSA